MLTLINTYQSWYHPVLYRANQTCTCVIKVTKTLKTLGVYVNVVCMAGPINEIIIIKVNN